jgi:hypothetical protein
MRAVNAWRRCLTYSGDSARGVIYRKVNARVRPIALREDPHRVVLSGLGAVAEPLSLAAAHGDRGEYLFAERGAIGPKEQCETQGGAALDLYAGSPGATTGASRRRRGVYGKQSGKQMVPDSPEIESDRSAPRFGANRYGNGVSRTMAQPSRIV